LVVDVGGKDIFHVKMGERVLANGGVVNPSHNMLNDGRGNKPRLRYLRGAMETEIRLCPLGNNGLTVILAHKISGERSQRLCALSISLCPWGWFRNLRLYVRFTPESGHSLSSWKESVNDPKRTLEGLLAPYHYLDRAPHSRLVPFDG
jgi:hypothetical protein